jgi:glycerophosphoryl diester phosphodiesterase
MKRRRALPMLLLAFLVSCELDKDVLVPTFGDSGLLQDTYPLTEGMKGMIDGVYAVDAGGNRFGSTVVLKWRGVSLSVFSGVNAGYFVLQGGRLDSVFFFEGYWRYQSGTETGLASIRINKEEGGRGLMGDSSALVPPTLRGQVGDGISAPSTPVIFRFLRPIRPELLQNNFRIVAHRGGGRTSEKLPHSENSVEIIRMAEQFGATGIEIDARLTHDGIPVLYHDNLLNPRLVQKVPLVGRVEDFTFVELRSLVRLINGEKIPTLDEALRTVVEETTLEFVWLDSKSEGVGLMSKVVPVQQKYLALARQRGRRLEIVVGLPTDATFSEFSALPDARNIPSLCELSPELVRQVNAWYWGPRWTLGTQDAEVSAMHAEGRRAIPWTLDQGPYMEQYLAQGSFDGFCTNYPSLLAYHYYVR